MIKKNPKIFDVFLFFNELDLLELRLKTLYNVVDYFIITEINETFSGKYKELIFKRNKKRYEKFLKKIVYNPISKKELKELQTEYWSNYTSDFNISLPHKHNGKPAKKLQNSLKREITHRDAAIYGLHDLASPEDIILLSDLDEIPNPVAIKNTLKDDLIYPHYFKMDWYIYWINNRVGLPWFGTVMFKFKNLKGSSLDNLRFPTSDEKNIPGKITKNGGWHFSYLGGSKKVMEKLKAHPFQGYKSQIAMILNKLNLRKIELTIKKNKDILFQNRKFLIVEIDDSYPAEILENKSFIKKYSFGID